MSYRGIDVSKWQGDINWKKVKQSGIQFAILRAVSTNNKGLYIDPYFEANYKEAKEQGIPVGAYFYSYATTIPALDIELEKLKEALDGKTFEYPIIIDVEDQCQKKLSKDALSELVAYACEKLESWGAYAMFYTYLNFTQNELNMNKLSEYDFWLACYRANRPAKPIHGIWQYSSSGKVNGISGNVDMNISYKDYPTIIKNAGLNDFTKGKKKTIVQLANECIAGLWGNGKTREKRLTQAGYSYDKVQDKVNELLGIK